MRPRQADDRVRRLQGPSRAPLLRVGDLDVGLLQRPLALLRAEPDQERVLPEADGQVAVQQEADAAEPPLLLDVLARAGRRRTRSASASPKAIGASSL
jgi:hypothetical protein